MTFLEFKDLVPAFSSNRIDLARIPKLLEKTNIALKQIGRDTIPLKLIKQDGSNRNILRRVDTNFTICIPKLVVDDTTEIDMDDDLIDAVALFVISGIEYARAPAYMKMYWSIIEAHENGLINGDVASSYTILEDLVSSERGKVVNRKDYAQYLNGDINELDFKNIGDFNNESI
jgi:hypothetical protein